jgi:hypothetical protein
MADNTAVVSATAVSAVVPVALVLAMAVPVAEQAASDSAASVSAASEVLVLAELASAAWVMGQPVERALASIIPLLKICRQIHQDHML